MASKQGFQRYLPFAKVDDDKRMVWGYASTPALDLDDEVVKLEAIKAALPDYLEWGNIREMHQPSAVGVATETTIDAKGLWLGAYVTDDQAWRKCKPTTLDDGTVIPPVYKGFSIGGQVVRKVGKNIEAMKLIEISLVDRPANPECRIEVVKGAQVVESGEACLVKTAAANDSHLTIEEVPDIGMFSRALRKMGLRLGIVKDSGLTNQDLTHPSGTIIGEHTHEHTEHGLLPAVPDHMPKDPANPDEGALHDAFRSHLLPLGKDAAESEKKPYGDVHYADPGFQEDGRHRYPVNNEQHIRAAWSYIHHPDNRVNYSPEQLSHIEGAIVSAWHNVISEEGPPSAKKMLGLTDDVAKALWNIPDLADAAMSLSNSANSLSWEFSEEGGDKPDASMADEARALAARTARLIAQIAEHEAGEIESSSTSKGVSLMPNNEELAKRVSRAAQEHLDRALHHVTKAAGCHKEAMSCCKALASMHKEAAMKAASGDLAKSDGTSFDHNAAADHVVKMHGALTQMMDHHDMAAHHIGKASGNVDTGNAAEFTGSHIAGAPVEHTGHPTPSAAPMPGKAAGTYTQAEVDLMVKNAALEAELNALKKSPAGQRRGMAFDSRVELGATVGTDKQSTLLKGVSVDRDDPDSVSRGAAKMIGNMLANPGMFGRPMNDPEFHGAAG
jgi:hypothetical protein